MSPLRESFITILSLIMGACLSGIIHISRERRQTKSFFNIFYSLRIYFLIGILALIDFVTIIFKLI